jgi:tRNA-specific 2-thiouridylase
VSDEQVANPISLSPALVASVEITLGLAGLKPHEPVAVALSGGVDSAVAALLLRERGHRVVALHMSLAPGDPPEPGEAVCALARQLGVPLHGVDLRPAFRQEIIEPFLEAYLRGRTPNPCVVCNPRIKFLLLRRSALDLGIFRLATGHYARILHPQGEERLRLFRARDRAKDQSYFLYGLNQEQLAHAVFPLGDLAKSQVRELAVAGGISGFVKPESQDICFVRDNDYRGLLEEHEGIDALPARGPVVDTEGRHLGQHDGIHRFTIGQRRGLGIPSSAAYYVLDLEPATNTVRVGRRRHLRRREFLVTDPNWVGIAPPATPLDALVQVRSRHEEAPAVLEPTPHGILVRFREPETAITPGQAAVFYRGEEVLGGGIIDRVLL